MSFARAREKVDLKRTGLTSAFVPRALLAALLICASPAIGQASLWNHVSVGPSVHNLTQASLSPQQLLAVDKLLRNAPLGAWECSGDDLGELIKGLRYEEVPVSETEHVLLVQAGAGCARGGQGSNGAMWLIRFNRDTPVLLASPSSDFSGWLYAIQLTESHGYRDVVLGWHMSAREADLSYFRYDGKLYRCVGNATATWDDDGKQTVIPKPK